MSITEEYACPITGDSPLPGGHAWYYCWWVPAAEYCARCDAVRIGFDDVGPVCPKANTVPRPMGHRT